MTKIENTMSITEVEVYGAVQCFCPIGKEYFNGEITVTMVPNQFIPDYIELEKFIRNLSGSSLLVEDCVCSIYEHIMDNYLPHKLKVECFTDSAAHYPVKVVRSCY